MWKKQFFSFCFQNFFDFWAKNFSDFRRKIFKKLSKLPSACPQEQLVALNFLKSFEPFWFFLQKLLAWFSKFYLRVQSKNCVRNKFLIFLFRFFSDFERKIFQTFGRKTTRLCQNYLLRLQGKNLWLDFCFKFWIISDFLQKPLAWFSKFYLRVQIKNCGKNSFFSFCFQNFFDFWAKIFSEFRRKIFKKLSKLPSACPQEQLVALNFLKSFEPFWIFYRNFWHGSQNSIYVSRVKIALETVFLFFFSDFFRFLSEKYFRLLAEKRQDFVKITFYVSRGKICGLNFF